MRHVTAYMIVALIAALCVAACEQAPEGYREAVENFDDFVGVSCPKEARLAVARKMGARSEDARVVHYGPTGRPDDTYYFAAMSRDGKVMAGIFDEASAQVPEVHYENEFNRDDFIWLLKCVRSEPPFGDRQVRYGTALPVEITYGPRDVTLEFVDGWLAPSQRWSTGKVKMNLAGTALLDEEHGLEFAFPGSK
ncbi:MAG TPA: hypothetical protein VMW93_08475 [bacterium]|nr:hypothetical protein [bacterium]